MDCRIQNKKIILIMISIVIKFLYNFYAWQIFRTHTYLHPYPLMYIYIYPCTNWYACKECFEYVKILRLNLQKEHNRNELETREHVTMLRTERNWKR